MKTDEYSEIINEFNRLAHSLNVSVVDLRKNKVKMSPGTRYRVISMMRREVRILEQILKKDLTEEAHKEVVDLDKYRKMFVALDLNSKK